MLNEMKSPKAVKIQYCSDLHIEFPENKNFLDQHPIVPVGEILILAGDIVPFAVVGRYNEFFDELSANFEMVYWIPGNHEYYHFDIAGKSNPLYESIRSNVILLNNQTVTYKNAEMIFTTLWSYISPANQWQVQQNVNDFHLIKMNGSKFTTHQFNQLHQTSFEFLQQAVKQNRGMQKIIVTHHVPTLMHYPVQYKGSEINEAFAVELFPFIETGNASHWIYGHHHCNTADFKIGNTTMVTNQLGYVQNNEHKLFNPSASIEI
jgi:DNA repair exonuclease SbcCD nuclease subunit